MARKQQNPTGPNRREITNKSQKPIIWRIPAIWRELAIPKILWPEPFLWNLAIHISRATPLCSAVRWLNLQEVPQ